MARKDLGGLAALGALGMLLAKKGDKGSSPAMERAAEKASSTKYEDDTYDPGIRSDRADVLDEMGMVNPRMKRNTETGDLYSPDEAITRPSVRRSTKASAPRKVQAAVDTKPMGGSGGGRGPAIGEVEAYQRNKPMTREQSLARLNELTGTKEMDPNADRGPNAVRGSELGRNVSNTLNALTPLGGGVGKAMVEGAMIPRTQRLYNEAAAARRSAEGFSPAEAVARRRMMEEAAFEGGMKKGGKVKAKAEKPAAKGWGKARGARGAKYY